MLQITISRRAAVIVALTMLLVIPATATATHIFTDVDDSSVHAPGIEWLANAGVTAGCGDGSTYCPDEPVTRAQMATFMHRLSGNAPGVDPSVVSTTTLNTYTNVLQGFALPPEGGAVIRRSTVSASCTEGDLVTGGGYSGVEGQTTVVIASFQDPATPNTWTVEFENSDVGVGGVVFADNVWVYVTCLEISS